jgi:hypothetical protein
MPQSGITDLVDDPALMKLAAPWADVLDLGVVMRSHAQEWFASLLITSLVRFCRDEATSPAHAGLHPHATGGAR